MAFIMAKQVLCCALPTWAGLTLSMSCHLLQHTHLLSLFRIKEKLRSGELVTAGDEWPLFLYQDYVYNSNDPWKGPFHSSLLVKVCLHMSTSSGTQPCIYFLRHSSIYLLHPVLSKKNQRQCVWEMPTYMEWFASCYHQLHTLQPKYIFLILYHILVTFLITG